MKADRLITLLLLLQSRSRRTARSLAEALEVSERTIYRDVDALCAAGVPLYAERGPEGGILLADGYRRALTHFGEDEIRALFISGSSPLADLGLDRGLAQALEKLRGGLPDVQRRAAEQSRARIHLDARRWNQGEPPRELLTVLRRVVWDDRRVRIRYEDRNRKATTRTIDPFGLVSKAGVWYLVARSAGEMRSFRVERIANVEELHERFERPPDFNLDVHWNETTDRFRDEQIPIRIQVTIRVHDPDFGEVVNYWESEEIDAAATGERILRVTFPAEAAAVHQLLAWGARVSIAEPLALRDLIVARAREILNHYKSTRRKSRSNPVT